MSCDNPLFPSHIESLPREASVPDVLLAAIPSALTTIAWVAVAQRRVVVDSAAVAIFLGSVAATATVLLAYRIVEVLACEGRLSSDWAYAAAVGLALLHACLLIGLAPSRPLLTGGLLLDAAWLCVAGEYAGRDLLRTAAVQYLLPLQACLCLASLGALAYKKPRLALPALSNLHALPLNKRPAPRIRA
jgi:hypothetical protein